MSEKLDPRIHFVAATAIIVKDGKYLIIHRASKQKVHPGKWAPPGGKIERTDYESLPSSTPNHLQWYNALEIALRREIREEVGIEIEQPQYVTNVAFIRPDGYPVMVFSFWAHYKSGEIQLNHEASDYKWVTYEEAKQYDMIDGIIDEIAMVDAALRAEH